MNKEWNNQWKRNRSRKTYPPDCHTSGCLESREKGKWEKAGQRRICSPLNPEMLATTAARRAGQGKAAIRPATRPAMWRAHPAQGFPAPLFFLFAGLGKRPKGQLRWWRFTVTWVLLSHQRLFQWDTKDSKIRNLNLSSLIYGNLQSRVQKRVCPTTPKI